MLKCRKEAFAKCPTRHLCGSQDEATFAEGSDCDKFNQWVMGLPMTNADRIRAMSDEELAKWLDNFFWGHKKVNLFDILKWLKQPAEDDHG